VRFCYLKLNLFSSESVMIEYAFNSIIVNSKHYIVVSN